MADILDQEVTSGVGDDFFGYGSTRDYMAQGVKVAKTGRLTKFGFRLKLAAADPGGIITGYLYTNNGGIPGILIATYSTVATSTLTGSYAWYYFSKALALAPTIIVGTTYQLAVHSSTLDINNYIKVEGGTNTYPDGEDSYGSSVPVWTAQATSDLNFRQYYDPTLISKGAFLLNFT